MVTASRGGHAARVLWFHWARCSMFQKHSTSCAENKCLVYIWQKPHEQIKTSSNGTESLVSFQNKTPCAGWGVLFWWLHFYSGGCRLDKKKNAAYLPEGLSNHYKKHFVRLHPRECRLAVADVCGDLICSLNKTMTFHWTFFSHADILAPLDMG